VYQPTDAARRRIVGRIVLSNGTLSSRMRLSRAVVQSQPTSPGTAGSPVAWLHPDLTAVAIEKSATIAEVASSSVKQCLANYHPQRILVPDNVHA
jgi:hypothetical protein